MLNYNPNCKAKRFIGGKVKRMIGLSGSPVRNHWLDEYLDETRKKIASGKYTSEALNFFHTFDNLIRPIDFY